VNQFWQANATPGPQFQPTLHDAALEDFLIHRADALTRSQRDVKEALQRAVEHHERDTRRLWKNLV
jgi:hypothetical protein